MTEVAGDRRAALGILEVRVPTGPFDVERHVAVAEVLRDLGPQQVRRVGGDQIVLVEVTHPLGGLNAGSRIEDRVEIVVEVVATVGDEQFVEATRESFFLAGELGTDRHRVRTDEVLRHVVHLVDGRRRGQRIAVLGLERGLMGSILEQVEPIVHRADVSVTGQQLDITIDRGRLHDGRREHCEFLVRQPILERFGEVGELRHETRVVPGDIEVDSAACVGRLQVAVDLETIAEEDQFDGRSCRLLEHVERLIHGLIRLTADHGHAELYARKVLVDAGVGTQGRSVDVEVGAVVISISVGISVSIGVGISVSIGITATGIVGLRAVVDICSIVIIAAAGRGGQRQRDQDS